MSRKLGEVKPCNHCDQPILWLRTQRSVMPVDADPATDGNIARDGHRAHVLNAAQAAGARAAGQGLYRHHKLSCPNAHLWVRGKAGAR